MNKMLINSQNKASCRLRQCWFSPLFSGPSQGWWSQNQSRFWWTAGRDADEIQKPGGLKTLSNTFHANKDLPITKLNPDLLVSVWSCTLDLSDPVLKPKYLSRRLSLCSELFDV